MPFRPSRQDWFCSCGKPLVAFTSDRDRKPLQRKRSKLSLLRPPLRIWDDARAKVELEGECRLGARQDCEGKLEAAHVIGCDRDQHPIEGLDGDGNQRAELWGKGWYVAPERIVPLCTRHHRLYDAHQVDLLGRLHLAEELQAVADSRVAGESGIESARVRTAPLAYRSEAA